MARKQERMNQWEYKTQAMNYPQPRVSVPVNGRKDNSLDLWAGRAGQPPLKKYAESSSKAKAQPKQAAGKIMGNADVWK